MFMPSACGSQLQTGDLPAPCTADTFNCAPPRERDPPHGFLTTHLEWNFPWGFLRPAQPIICQLSPLSPQIAAVADLSGNIAEERRSFGVAFCRDRQASGVQDAHTFFTLRKLAWQQHRTHLEKSRKIELAFLMNHRLWISSWLWRSVSSKEPTSNCCTS